MQARQYTWPHRVMQASLMVFRQIVHWNSDYSLSVFIFIDVWIYGCRGWGYGQRYIGQSYMITQLIMSLVQLVTQQQQSIYLLQDIKMFDLLMGPKIPATSTNFLTILQSTIKNNESFLRTVEKWRNLQVSYIGKLAQLHSEATERTKKLPNSGDNMLMTVLDTLQNQHKNLTNKFNHDIFMVNFADSEKQVYEQKSILENQKLLHRELCAKKQILEKVRTRKLKLKKSMEQELTLHVFSHDSVEATMDKKVKRFNKMKQIEKQQQQYELKVKQSKQIFDIIIQKAKGNINRFNQLQKVLLTHRFQIVQKIKIHLSTYAKALGSQIDELCQQMINNQVQNQQLCAYDICNDFIQEQQVKIINTIRIEQGYLETTLKIINDKTLDSIIEYSKDKEVKKKIKQIIESDEVNAQETDQFTRQVQIVKKILKNKDSSSLSQYKVFITKGCKFRMNFVFILQMYRLNSQFQINIQELKPIILLINELLVTCHQNRDAFVLKQTMVLMLTYYVAYHHGQKTQKIYILNLFKHQPFWRDLELWESILIQCIYLEKKATIKMILTTSVVSNKNQLIEAEKTSVLNQILYVVRNMILFDFTEKEVKQFSNKFVRMLKQDDRFLKDVYKSIDNAIKEEADHKPPEAANKFISELTKVVE